jgi:hypothetical protein
MIEKGKLGKRTRVRAHLAGVTGDIDAGTRMPTAACRLQAGYNRRDYLALRRGDRKRERKNSKE